MYGFRVSKASEATLLGMLTNGILHDELRTVWLVGLSYEVKTSLLKEMCGFRVCKASQQDLRRNSYILKDVSYCQAMFTRLKPRF